MSLSEIWVLGGIGYTAVCWLIPLLKGSGPKAAFIMVGL